MISAGRQRWLLGAAVLVMLALKALMATSWVAGTVENIATDALGAQGLDAVRFVEVEGVGGIGGDGVDVVLEGPASDEAAAVAAVGGRDEIANVTYLSVGGEETAAARAETEQDDGLRDDQAAGQATAEAAPSTPGSVEVAIQADSVVLTGAVADEAARSAVLAEANARFGAANVVDRLTTGNVTSDGGTVTISGEASSTTQKSEWSELADAIASGLGSTVVDQVEVVVTAVPDRLNELFALDPIEFDTARAEIRPQSIPTLDAAAELINADPDGPPLLVVGHTDSDGDAADNLALSAARAEAVVAYLVERAGVDPARLDAEGRGDLEPLVTPETSAEDKQRNRRIAWEPGT